METSDRFDILIHVQPWQGLLLESEPLVDLAAGGLGATGLALSVKAAEQQEVVTLDPAGHLLAGRVPPGALWQPDVEQYASTRLRPQASAALKGRQPAGRLADLCRARSQVFALRVSALWDAALAARHAEAAACNALSLPAGNHLCPSNPDVVELVRCQLADLAGQFAPDVIELEHFTRPDRYQPGPATAAGWPAPPGAAEAALLALCFCPSCRQQATLAGVEASAALRSVQVWLMRWLQNERPFAGTVDDLLAEDEILAGYIACQRRGLLSAVRLWARAVPCLSLVVAREQTSAQPASQGQEPPASPDAYEPDAIGESSRAGSPWNPSFEELTEAAPRLTVLIPPHVSDHPCACPGAAGWPGRAQLSAVIDATSPSFASGPDIVRCLTDLARTGVAGIELEGGLAVSPSRRPFIRQAIRAARRERTL